MGWDWVHLVLRPLFGLFLPAPDNRWRWLWSNRWNAYWQGKPKYSKKTCPSATSSTTNPTWPDPGSNPGSRGGKPATNHLNYGAALTLSNIGPKAKLWIYKYMRLSKGGLLEIIPRKRIFLTKLMVAHLVKKFPSFMEPKRSYPCSQQSERNVNNGAATENILVIKLISGSKREFHWFPWLWQFSSGAGRNRVFAWVRT
jgi:hypothetical protein